MPRPVSPLTGRKPRSLVARLTEQQHIMFLRLGGSRWIRSVIDEEIAKAKKAKDENDQQRI